MIEALTTELRERAAFLLEAGRDTAGARAMRDFAPAPVTTIAGALHAAETLGALMPGLLEDAVERVVSFDRRERTSRPVRAELSRAPSAYDRDEHGVWFPKYWLRPVEVETTALEPLRWLVSIVERVDVSLAELSQRFEEQRDEIETARGELHSVWSNEELGRLTDTITELRRARERLARAQRSINLHVGGSLRPLARLPRPFPTGRHWRTLRRLLRYWLDPALSFGGHLDRALCAPVNVADLPYLYERWCCLQLLDVLAMRGYRPPNAQKALWTVFLGGCIELPHESLPTVELWVEPRIGRAGHECGLSATGSELSPDIVLNITTAAGVESIILDPTLGRATDHLQTKGRYATLLKRAESRVIAGVPVVKHPRRAWAIAPLSERSCRLLGFAETVGVIPLLPGDTTLQPLDAFLDDLLPHSQ